MTVNRLPPPPVANDFKSPAWQDWFYKLIALLNTALPGASTTVLDSTVFGRPHPLTAPPNLADSQHVQAIAALLRAPVQPVNTADSQTILAGQIFGG